MMQKPIKRKDLLDAAINQKISTVEIKLVTLSEGQPMPKHFQVDGGESKILKEGDAFYELKGKTVLHSTRLEE
jgi:hypothetical protein